MMDGGDDFRALMLTLYQRLGALQRDEICCEGVTVSQCYTLQVLRERGEMGAGELARELALDASTVTRAIDVLVRNGAVERIRPDRGDRRRVLVRLTRSGRALEKKLRACGDELFQRVLESFPLREKPVVFRVLRALRDALEPATHGACRSC